MGGIHSKPRLAWDEIRHIGDRFMSTSLREMVIGLLRSLDQKKELQSLDACTQDMLDRALDKIVEGTDSKISLVPGYKRKLYRSIIKSLQFADSMIEQIPQPIELGNDQLAANPYVRAFFSTLAGLVKTCGQSSELKEFYQDSEHRQSTEICALLCMRKVEETVLGMELEAGHVIKDVMQTQVTFTNHRIQSPAETPSIARRELKCCIFEGLVDNALANISALRARRRQLETQQQILSSRLRSNGGGTVNNEALSDIAMDDLSFAEAEIKLGQVQQELQKVGYVTPEVSLEQINTTLGHPEDFVSINSISMKLDRQGILRSGDEHSRSISKLDLSEISIQGRPPRVVTLVSVRRDELVFPEISFPHTI